MLPFIQAPAIIPGHTFSFGSALRVLSSSFETWPSAWFSFVPLCQVVSQHSSQVKAVAPSTLSVLPKTLPTSFERACRLGDKASERVGFESANRSCFLWSFYRFTLSPLKLSVWGHAGTLPQFLSWTFVPAVSRLDDVHTEILLSCRNSPWGSFSGWFLNLHTRLPRMC